MALSRLPEAWTFRLRHGTTMGGIVVAAAEQPVEGATVLMSVTSFGRGVRPVNSTGYDAAGHPIEGARVLAFTVPPIKPIAFHAWTDEHGLFEMGECSTRGREFPDHGGRLH